MVIESKRIKELENRIDRIENILDLPHTLDIKEVQTNETDLSLEENFREDVEVRTKKSVSLPKLSFNQIITFLGVTGIIIGAISFFFYAVANNWIGETGQVAIGIVIGFLLFGAAFMLRDKNKAWSNIVFGGSYFIEYLSLGVGVHEYKVIPEILALVLALVFLISSISLTLKFGSRSIAYFSLIGGYLIPFITGYQENDLFVLGFTLLISLALVIVSYKYNWSDLRVVSLAFVTILLGMFNYELSQNVLVSTIFLVLIYMLFNVSSLIFSIKKKEGINHLDSLILVFLPIIILGNLYSILEIGLIPFGFIIILNAFVYLAEIVAIKILNKEVSESLRFSLFGAGFTLLNIGLLFVLKEINIDIFLVIFMVQWLMFSYISKIAKVDQLFYKIISYIFLSLVVLWYLFALRFDAGIVHASIYMIVLAGIVGGFLFLNRNDIDKDFNGALFLISIFVYIFSFSKYIWFLGVNSEKTIEIVLSILWLIYTLSLLIFVNLPQKARYLIIGLLCLTLLKIAFQDLSYLDGAYRIIGFILFGILLLIGGFFIKNDKQN